MIHEYFLRMELIYSLIVLIFLLLKLVIIAVESNTLLIIKWKLFNFIDFIYNTGGRLHEKCCALAQVLEWE